MIRKACIIGTAALGLAISIPAAAPSVCRFVSSAQNARHYFHDLEGSGNRLSAIERFVVSLVLANTKAAAAPKPSAPPANRS